MFVRTPTIGDGEKTTHRVTPELVGQLEPVCAIPSFLAAHVPVQDRSASSLRPFGLRNVSERPQDSIQLTPPTAAHIRAVPQSCPISALCHCHLVLRMRGSRARVAGHSFERVGGSTVSVEYVDSRLHNTL